MSSLLTRSGGALRVDLRQGVIEPGTQMNPNDCTRGSSGWETENGMIWLRWPIVTRIRLSGSSSAVVP